jgi:hypothetical protein
MEDAQNEQLQFGGRGASEFRPAFFTATAAAVDSCYPHGFRKLRIFTFGRADFIRIFCGFCLPAPTVVASCPPADVA